MPRIVGWPGTQGQFDHPTLFQTGAESTYVLPEHRPAILSLFPRARFAKIPETGHWLHAEKPAPSKRRSGFPERVTRPQIVVPGDWSWWSRGGSNPDLVIANDALSQLSYCPRDRGSF